MNTPGFPDVAARQVTVLKQSISSAVDHAWIGPLTVAVLLDHVHDAVISPGSGKLFSREAAAVADGMISVETQQQCHDIGMPVRCGEEQGGVTLCRLRIHVGTVLEKALADMGAAIGSGIVQGPDVIPGYGQIDVCTTLDEHAYNLNVIRHGGEVQR